MRHLLDSGILSRTEELRIMPIELFDRLIAIRQRMSQIGSRTNFRLNRCISADEVDDFESHWQVTLPQPYRQFLLTVGNGGVGPPAYGMVRLGEVPDGSQYGDMTSFELLRNLHRPFPFTAQCTYDEFGRATGANSRAAIDDGRLVLGTDGCAMNWLLVVSGPERGNIWFENEGGMTPCPAPRDFLNWYERWLNWAESGKKRSAFYADVLGWADDNDDDNISRPGDRFRPVAEFNEDDIPL